MEDKFKLYKKWFWVGMIMGLLNGFAGIVYGIALAFEPEHRQEGTIIAIFSLAITILAVTAVRYLQIKGVLPPTPML